MSQSDSGVRELLNDATEAAELPREVTIDEVADASRDALVRVMAGVDWGKVELAGWLSGPYRRVTSFAAQSRESIAPETVRPPAHVLRRIVRVDTVGELLRATRERVIAALHRSTPSQTEIAAAKYSGFVSRCRDASGRAGWVPVDVAAMGLYDRIVSLAVADYLMRPSDYLGLLGICRVCGALSFDARCRAEDVCKVHMPSIRRIAVR